MGTLHTLSLSGPSGTLFRITDGASRCVGMGIYRTEIALPPGLYTVSATLGRSIESRVVLLDQAQSIDWGESMRSFGDRAFSLAPDVLAVIGAHDFADGGQLIALRGPWRNDSVSDSGVTLDRDGVSVEPVREGFVSDPQAPGVWRWQLFDLAPDERPIGNPPGVLSVTRRLEEPGPRMPEGSEDTPTQQRQVSHVLPQWGDWAVWAAYPARADEAPDNEDLPTACYARLRLTTPGAAPDLKLQGLSDQVFTALAARTSLPFSKLVLDQLLLSDDADPLLALAAAHLTSIAIGWQALGQHWPIAQHQLSQDASPAEGSRVEDDPYRTDMDEAERRFRDWLVRHENGPLAGSADMVALLQLFGLSPRAHLREPPVLLRSLDALLQADATSSTDVTLDPNVWSQRLQLSESFAFLQWQADADYDALVMASVQRSLQQLITQHETDRVIYEAHRQVERERLGSAGEAATVRIVRSPGFASPPDESFGAAFESAFAAPFEENWVDLGIGRAEPVPVQVETLSPAPMDFAPSLDFQAFVQSSATSLRMPASTALSTLEAALRQASPRQTPVGAWALQGSQQLKAD